MSPISPTLPSAGRQALYDKGVLPTDTSASTLKNASASQLNQLANSNIQSQQINALFGYEKTISDSAKLSTTAMDSLTQAVNDQLTSKVNAAVDKFLPKSSLTTGTKIDFLA